MLGENCILNPYSSSGSAHKDKATLLRKDFNGKFSLFKTWDMFLRGRIEKPNTLKSD